jgi:hypothetical protein
MENADKTAKPSEATLENLVIFLILLTLIDN